MKLKNNSCRKIKLSFATSPLLRFKLRKHRKLKCNALKQSLGNKIIFTEEISCPLPTESDPSRPCEKPKSRVIVSNEISDVNRKDDSPKVSVVQMPTKCKRKVKNVLNLSIHNSEKDDTDLFSSLQCLVSTGYKVSPSRFDKTLCQNNSESLNINQVRISDKPLHSTKLRKQKSLKENVCADEYERKCSITVRTKDNKLSSANVYELNCSKYLIIIKPECYFYVVGIVELGLVQGSVEVLGYTVNEQSNNILIFSPVGYSNLFIKATAHGNNKSIKLEDLLSLGLSEKTSLEVVRESKNCSAFTLSKKTAHVSSSIWPYFFENHLSFSIFPLCNSIATDQENRSIHLMECRIGCIINGNIQDRGKEFIELSEWPRIVDEISLQDHDSPKVILCGGKSVGKSSLLRYMINKFLKKWNKVLVLDFDPGQCEFTVPGCISAVCIEEPVFGPNFTHLQEPIRSVFLGEIDVTKCPEHYIEGCKLLINHAKKELDSIPWLVNTMGFSRGFGVTLICGTIQNIGPTNVIQIESKNKNFNYPSLLEPAYVYNQDVGSFSTEEDLKMYQFHILSSGAEYQASNSQKIRGISPPEARNLVVLSYLSNMLNSKTASLSQVTPYMINMDQIALQTTNKCNLSKAQIAATMNGTLVALCSQTGDDEFPNCHGFGIVRGVDMQAGVLFLITPVSIQTLGKVNCLIKGNVAFPESLYYNQGHQVEGHIPYLAHTSGGSTALFAKRDYRTLPTTPRQSTKRQSM